MAFLQRLGQAQPNVSSASQHDAVAGLFHQAKFAHHSTDIVVGRNKENFVVRFDDRITVWNNRLIVTVDCGNARFGRWQMVSQLTELVTY